MPKRKQGSEVCKATPRSVVTQGAAVSFCSTVFHSKNMGPSHGLGRKHNLVVLHTQGMNRAAETPRKESNISR